VGKWADSLNEIAALSEQIGFLTRIAIQTNQRATALELAKLLDLWRNISVRVTVVGKIGSGAEELARELAVGFGPRLSTELIETAAYDTLAADVWEEARRSAAIVCVIPSTAPLFDETQEILEEEFAGVAQKLFVTARSNEGPDDAVVPDIRQALSTDAELAHATVTSGQNLASVLEPFLNANYLQPLVRAMRDLIQPSVRRLRPVVSAFAAFLAMDQASFARQLDYIQRDLDALQALGQRAQEKLQAQSQASLGSIANQVTNLSTAMRQQAESVIQPAAIAHEILSSQDARTRFGRELTATARAAGYREFDARVRGIATNLSSARSLLLSGMDQMREEAEARVEELRLNIGPELFATLLQPPLDTEADRLMKVPLDPGDKYLETMTAAIGEIRRVIPDVPFSSNWAAGRIESMFRSEMNSNASSGWSLQTLDGPAAVTVAETWRDTTVREAGLLIGRVSSLVAMVQSGLATLRLKSLQIPKNSDARAKIGRAFAGYAERLRQMGEGS
jgi:hypothetical protein